MQSTLVKKFLKKIPKTVKSDEDQKKAKPNRKQAKRKRMKAEKTQKKRMKANESKKKKKIKIKRKKKIILHYLLTKIMVQAHEILEILKLMNV